MSFKSLPAKAFAAVLALSPVTGYASDNGSGSGPGDDGFDYRAARLAHELRQRERAHSSNLQMHFRFLEISLERLMQQLKFVKYLMILEHRLRTRQYH